MYLEIKGTLEFLTTSGAMEQCFHEWASIVLLYCACVQGCRHVTMQGGILKLYKDAL